MHRTLRRLAAAVLLVLVASYLAFGRLARPLGPCEAPIRETADRLAESMAFIERKGALLLGDASLGRLAERSHAATAGFRICCVVLQAGALDPAQFARCRTLFEDFATRLDGITAAVRAGSDPAAGEALRVAFAGAETNARELDQQVQLLTGIRPTATSQPAGASEHEPNDTFATARPLAFDHAVMGTISGVVDRDFFRLRGDGGGRDRARLVLRNRSMTLAPQIILFDARRTRLREYYDVTAGASLEVHFTVEPNQDRYVEVLRVGREGGDYELTLTQDHAADAYEPNDDAFTATPVHPGPPLAANLLDEQDADWYRVTAAADAALAVRLENRSATLAPRVRVYDHNRAEIGERHSVRAGESLDLVLPGARDATYYLEVAPVTGGGGGPYELRVSARAG
jgi:hypothetical protein